MQRGESSIVDSMSPNTLIRPSATFSRKREKGKPMGREKGGPGGSGVNAALRLQGEGE